MERLLVIVLLVTIAGALITFRITADDPPPSTEDARNAAPDAFSEHAATSRPPPLVSDAPHSVSRISVDNSAKREGGARAVLPEHRSMIARAVKMGVLKDSGIVLQTAKQWQDLYELWTTATSQVTAAQSSRLLLAQEIAAKRLVAGKYQAFEVDESTRLPSGGFSGPWNDKTHPDEILSNTYKYREGGGQIIHSVRLPPGEVPEIDEATLNLRLLDELRREAVLQLIQQNSYRN